MDLVFTYDARRCIEVGASFAVRVQAIARTRDNDLLIQALLVTQSIVQRFGGYVDCVLGARMLYSGTYDGNYPAGRCLP